MIFNFIKKTPWSFSLILAMLCQANSLAQQTEPLQHYWELHPDFGDIWTLKLPNRSPHFDKELLRSKSIQDRIDVSQLICQHYAKDNFEDRDGTLSILFERLTMNDEPEVVKRSMLSAACLLAKSEHAEALWKIAKADEALSSIVEPWLIRWKSSVAAGAWRDRLNDAKADPGRVSIAIKGLHALNDPLDADLFVHTIKGNNTARTNRYLAACALGDLCHQGYEPLASQIIDSKVVDAKLVAANVIRRHKSSDAEAIVLKLIEDKNDPAYPVAAKTLAENFPEKAITFAAEWGSHADNNVRTLALELLNSVNDVRSLELQSSLLSDRNISVRRLAGKQVVDKAQRGQREQVDRLIDQQLASESWTGIEQSIIVVTQLNDAHRCERLVELLEHQRAEVNMHAAWALMELAHEAETLDAIHAHCKRTLKRLLDGDRTIVPTDGIRLSFLYEAIGRNRYEPARETLVQYIPKDTRKGNVCRASAIWALGQIYSGKGAEDICKLLQGRVEDAMTMIPEDYLVRYTSILALGEMNYVASRDSILTYGGEPPSQLGYASQWTLNRFAK